MQFTRMIIISVLTGLVGFGVVWLGWDLFLSIFRAVRERRKAQRLAAEKAALAAEEEENAEAQ